MKQIHGMHARFSEVKRILHEILEEPGPSFSCYCLKADCTAGCVDCEIHCNGMRKPAIQISRQQLECCINSTTGRDRLKEYLKSEIDNLAGEEEDWGFPVAEDLPPPA